MLGIVGPCAKKRVICTLLTVTGEKIVGTNDCRRPQVKCPRAPGEGYEKCKTICDQEGHAEEIALKRAGDKAKGAIATLEGITHYCRACQEKLFAAGVEALMIKGE